MKRSIRSLTAGGLAVLCLLARGVPAKTDSLAVDERVQRVFPFEVGQKYEFKSAHRFFRPNGESLAPYTRAEITVSDTVINGKTYLHIPYWSSFGTEYYRLDDSLRVWNYNLGNNEERVFLYLGRGGCPRSDIGGGITCPCYEVTGWRAREPICNVQIGWLFRWGYGDATSQHSLFRRIPMSIGGAPDWDELSSGWAMEFFRKEVGEYDYRYISLGDTVLGYSFDICCEPEVVFDVYGIGGPGGSRHLQGFGNFPGIGMNGVGLRTPWAVFRPVSDAPWPTLTSEIVSVAVAPISPQAIDLACYPNPFNPTTLIAYAIPAPGHVTLRVYNTVGQPIRTLVARQLAAGNHSFRWDGLDDAGMPVGSGMYLIRLTTPTAVATQRVTLLR